MSQLEAGRTSEILPIMASDFLQIYGTPFSLNRPAIQGRMSLEFQPYACAFSEGEYWMMYDDCVGDNAVALQEYAKQLANDEILRINLYNPDFRVGPNFIQYTTKLGLSRSAFNPGTKYTRRDGMTRDMRPGHKFIVWVNRLPVFDCEVFEKGVILEDVKYQRIT